jgi:pimeloyl-ACP methyl ester carboxylesterase/DNA-binding SARP family transcriptional activator
MSPLEFADRPGVDAMTRSRSGAKAPLQLRVLGRFAVLRHEIGLPLPRSKKTRALLAYLAVTNRAHSRDRLCAMFWPIPDDPRAALRWSLSRLRPLVDERDCRRLIADRESVGVDLSHVDVDLLSLRSLAGNGLDAVATDALHEAVEALQGDFLEGLELPDCLEFQSWCTGERESARRLRARLLAALIRRLEGTPDQALPHARALSLIEPADEAVHATLVRLLRASGRAREAEEEFQRAHRRLREFNVVCNGALKQAAQVPLHADAGRSTAEVVSPRPQAEQAPASALHDVQFCRTTDGVRIAYAKVGNGPPLVWAAHWMSHLSFSWQSPVWRHWTDQFAKDHCFVHYDERGNGLSDWDCQEFSVDAFVRDLEAVVDTIGLDRFALMGSSKGGPTAMAYAARHPERVSHLILYGTFAQGWRILGDNDDIVAREAVIALIQQGWARDNPAIRQFMTSHFLPDASLEEMGWFNDLQRVSAPAENAARLFRALGDFNVLDLLPGIAAPTLVLHCRDDAATRFEQGRLIASRIPQARFVELEGSNHVLLPRDPAWARFVAEVRGFLGCKPAQGAATKPR